MRKGMDDRARYQRLIAAGCPVDAPQQGAADVDIFQIGTRIDSETLQLPYGVAYIVRLKIVARQSFRIADFELTMPGPPRYLELLAPAGRVGREYIFPGSGPFFPRASVLNHHAENNTKLPSGDSLEGFLLLYDLGGRLPLEPIRTQLATVSLYDTLGRVVSCPVELIVQCGKTTRAIARRDVQRTSLFADDEQPGLKQPLSSPPQLIPGKEQAAKKPFIVPKRARSARPESRDR